MPSYLSFIHHGIESAGEPLDDGRILTQHCLRQLEALNDPKQFPPRLLILLASPAYLDSLKSEQLLDGVLQTFAEAGHRELPLIGCSVAAVFFNRRIYHEGALLVCLASRLLKAKLAVSPNASYGPEKAVKSLLKKLDLLAENSGDLNRFADRTLFAFFPGFGGSKYLAPELHELLRDNMRSRIPIFGGVASANDPDRIQSGLLFANREVHRNALVAARVMCGTPFGISLTHGLTDTGRTLGVAELDPQDCRIIRRFREGGVIDVMEQEWKQSPVVLFTNMALDRDPTVDTPKLEGKTLRLTREIHKGEPFHLLIPKPEKMLPALRKEIKRSLQGVKLENPIAGLGFRCTGLLRYSKDIGIDLEQESALIERDLYLRDRSHEKPFVGGFVDGEAGVDKNSKSMLGNWSNATLIFGDELRDRTPVYRGFKKLADFAGMSVARTLNEGIDRLTKLIYDIGFPGAMLSLWMPDQEQDTIVARSASGSHYEKLCGITRCHLNSDDILAIVAREKEAQFIRSLRQIPHCDSNAASDAGIISQYLIPLTAISGEVNAVLQFDLGDASYKTYLYPTEKKVLDSLGKIVNSSLNRIFYWEESKILRKLDRAMSKCLSAKMINEGLQQYLEVALKAFGLKMGHIRIAQEDEHCLNLVAGVGDYFEESRKKRRKIDFGDLSPTTQAFRDEKITIVNDAEHNKAHQEMCQRWEQEEALYQKLRGVKSYANIPFKSERGERGTINLVSSKAWFFTWFHKQTLEALGERVGFLLETLRNKQRESFLLGVSPQVSQIQDLNDVSTVLANEITQFAKTVGAEFAALYLWEEDQQCYILRAQYGWKNPEWVNAARYGEHDRWTGTTALAGTPRHISDLYNYYKEHKYPETGGRYTAYALGQELSSNFTVEAISLQLRIANKRLGVLTLYRQINPGDESGFVTTDTKLLQQGADNFAGLISILQTNRRENWEKQERARRQEVYDSTIPAKGAGLFETRVCRQALKSYHAIKASFYQAKAGDKTHLIHLQTSFRRHPQTNQVEESAVSPDEEKLVIETEKLNRHNKKKVLVERAELKEYEWGNPERVAIVNLVKRACIPLFGEKQLVGFLDLHWSFNHQQVNSPDYQHNESFLRALGEIVGSAYLRSQTRRWAETMQQEAQVKLQQGKTMLQKSEERTQDAIQATSAYVLQHHHELRTIIQKMNGTLDLLRNASARAEKERRIVELSQQIKKGDEAVRRMIEIGRMIVYPARERLLLKNLIRFALKEVRGKYTEYEIKVNPLDISELFWVDVDPKLIKIAFTNLLDNAIKFMKGKKKRELTISATSTNDKRMVKITIKDTGIGMTKEESRQALREFFKRNGRISVGVTITRMILGLHNGELDYDSVKGDGTKTFVTLPLNHTE